MTTISWGLSAEFVVEATKVGCVGDSRCIRRMTRYGTKGRMVKTQSDLRCMTAFCATIAIEASCLTCKRQTSHCRSRIIRSGRIRAVAENQTIIQCDVCDHLPARNIYRRD